MKKLLLSLMILSLIIASCNNKRKLLEKEKLIGKWYHINSPETILEFTQDSLIVISSFSTLHNWNIRKNRIILINTTTIYHDPIDSIEWVYDTQFTYLLSSNLDTLFWTASRSDYNETLKLIKLKDQFEYYQKLIKLKIDLPYS